MEHGIDSLYTKPREWAEWIIGTFDPTFKKVPYFFKGWEQDVDAISALLIRQQNGYDKAQRFAVDEVDNEMMLLQACVGPDVFVYKMPYLPPAPKSPLPAAILKVSQEGYTPKPINSWSDYLKHIEDSATIFVAITAALLILSVLGLL